MRLGTLVFVWLVVACEPGNKTVPEEAGGRVDGGGTPGADAGGDASTVPLGDVFVYAHSATDLYRVHPETLEVSHVGAFGWPASVGSDQMTDIALDAEGNMTGISFYRVYSVDKETAVATHLSDLDQSFNGLSYVPAGGVDTSSAEVLVAAAEEGDVYRLHPMTGVATPLGSYGSNLWSSGDVVSVAGFGTVATVVPAFAATDSLARVDPMTGAATVIGNTGVSGIWGLGFWGDKVYGFTWANQFVLLDVTTGAATIVETGEVEWWGAGVTTAAYVID